MKFKEGQKCILVTGCAGFIGMHTSQWLLNQGYIVIGVDNLNDYYDPSLKQRRLNILKQYPDFYFELVDIGEYSDCKDIFKKYPLIKAIIHLAAQAGVRYSLENPLAYLKTNEQGMIHLCTLAYEFNIKNIIVASTSSVYGDSVSPYCEDDCPNIVFSPYAASKKAMEMYCSAYSHCLELNIQVLRYFTVYGPFGRPDMSILRFIKWIDEGTPLSIYGDGTQKRDFTYIDDVVNATYKVLESQLESKEEATFNIFNVGNNHSYTLNDLILLIEKYQNKEAVRDYQQFNKADTYATCADLTKISNILGWRAEVSFEVGIQNTVQWYYENKDWFQDVKLI